MSSTEAKVVAIVTSGGDSAGMNAAVRASARAALSRGWKVVAVYEGYEGLVAGGDKFLKVMTWADAAGLLAQGGTALGTARCPEFRTRAGRVKAAANLYALGVTDLVMIGGDGSLTGANLFRQEWPELVEEAVSAGMIEKREGESAVLGMVGMVGSIDNDMIGTDMTIGAATALLRIVEAVDNLSTTAGSHRRTFVVEVMGRHCGWLALMAATATGADYVFLPECPVPDWEKSVCDALSKGRNLGTRYSTVILSEGATDVDGNDITAGMVSEVIERELDHDTRVTILGHVQRGGAPCAYDRILATLMGVEAIEVLAGQSAGDEAQLIATDGRDFVRRPLMACVADTRAVADARKAKDWDAAAIARGPLFKTLFQTYRDLRRGPRPGAPPPGSAGNVAVIHVGAAAPGMNTAVRAVARLLTNASYNVFGVRDSFYGLHHAGEEAWMELTWATVAEWSGKGGANLGTARWVPTTPEDLFSVAKAFESKSIVGVVLIGGYECFGTAHALAASGIAALGVPWVVIPTTISNNAPGTGYSIGTDTALNVIVDGLDRIKESATSSLRRVFTVEVHGSKCGWLAVMSGLAGGAEITYHPEDGLSLDQVANDLVRIRKRFEGGSRMAVIVQTDGTNPSYTTEFVGRMAAEEGKGFWTTRGAQLGHLQQGGAPSPLDRMRAVDLGAAAVETLIGAVKNGAKNGRVRVFGVGTNDGGGTYVTAIDELEHDCDKKARRPLDQWWMKHSEVAESLSWPSNSS